MLHRHPHDHQDNARLVGWSRWAGAHPLRRFVRRGRLGADRVRDLILQAIRRIRGAGTGERRMVYTCLSNLAACCADSRRYEPLLTRSSLTS